MIGLRNMVSLRIVTGLLVLGTLMIGMANLSHSATIGFMEADGVSAPVAQLPVSFENAEAHLALADGTLALVLGNSWVPQVQTGGFSSITHAIPHMSSCVCSGLRQLLALSSPFLTKSTAPVKPVSSSPSSALLFVPALVGILGVAFRGGSSVKTLKRGNASQSNRVSSTNSILILVLSADAKFGKETEAQLRRLGHCIRVVPTVEEVFSLASHTRVSLALVDPRVSDWDMLRTDTKLKHVPMMALIPLGFAYSEDDCQADLERGIDGVHLAQEGPRLLIAKVAAYLRRAGHDVSRRGVYQVGAVELDADIHEVKVGGQRIPLSAKPFVLLEAFMRAPSKAFSRGELIDLVWGPDFAIGHHTLDVHVHALRQVLDQDPSRLCQLMTIKGVGFKLTSLSPAIVASSMPDTLPMAVNSLPSLCPGAVHGLNTQRINAPLPSTSQRTWLGQVPRQRRAGRISRKMPVRHLRSVVSVG